MVQEVVSIQQTMVFRGASNIFPALISGDSLVAMNVQLNSNVFIFLAGEVTAMGMCRMFRLLFAIMGTH